MPDRGPASESPLLDVQGLTVRFPMRSGFLQRAKGHTTAVDGISFSIGRGETLGLVGESGCGKTTAGRAILRLIPAQGGAMRFDGEDVLAAPAARLRRLRRHMQIIFQDPGSSLNPRLTIEDALTEPLVVHRVCASAADARQRAVALLDRCGMPASALTRYPHEFSGGQKQRIAIARALALEPHFIVCDEPTSALDVSIQAQVLNLLGDLQRDLGLSYLFISHDMGVIQHICTRIAVMQQGRIVELAARDDVLRRPTHPYTQKLLAAVPKPAPAAA